MNDSIEVEMICNNCRATLPPGDGCCEKCGTARESLLAATDQDTDSASKSRTHRRLLICVIIFGVQFLGLPVLWKSRHFSRTEKAFWSIVVLVESALLVLAIYWLIMSIVHSYRENF